MADLEGEAEGGAVAEAFFLGEGAVLEAAAGVGGVGHVEDEDWWVGGGGGVDGGGEGEELLGDVDGVAVDDADGGRGEFGAVGGVEGWWKFDEVAFFADVGARGE